MPTRSDLPRGTIELCVCQHPLAAHDPITVAVIPRDTCRWCKDAGRAHPCEQFTPISTVSRHYYHPQRTGRAEEIKIMFLARGDRILFRFDGELLIPVTHKTGALVAEATGVGHYEEGGRDLWVAGTDLGTLAPWPRNTPVLVIRRKGKL